MQLTRKEAINYLHDNTKQILDRILAPSKDGKGWVCGIDGCKHGTNGDGLIIQKNNIDNNFTLHCFGCGFHGDIFNFVGAYYHLNDFNEQLQFLCDMENIEIIQKFNEFDAVINNNDFVEPKKLEVIDRPALKNIHTHNKPLEEAELKKDEKLEFYIEALENKDIRFKELIKQAQQRITEPEAINYIFNIRGLTEKSVKYYKLGYATKIKVGNRIFEKCIITPSSYASYSVRDINPNVSQKDKIRKPRGVPDIPLGMKQVIENKNKPISNDYIDNKEILEPIFIVEGLFDAPSVYEAGGDAVALNGIGATSFIKIYKHYGLKRPVLIALDNDSTGQSRQEKIYKELQEAGIEAYPIELITHKLYKEAGIKDANDYLIYDKPALIKAVEEAKKFPYMEFLKDFNEFQKEAYLNRIKSKRHKISTGFKVLDSKEYLDGGLDEGLIGIGAISSLGKTAFSLQLADQLATAGHDVIYYSLEMSSHELRDRSISRYTAKNLLETKNLWTRNIGNEKGLTYNPYAKTQSEINHIIFNPDRNTDPAHKAYVEEAINQYFNDTGGRLRIVEGVGTIDVDNIKELVEKHIKFTGRKPIVFIDYLQLLIQPKDENGRRPSMTDKQIVDANIFRLKQISRDYHIPIWIISSFNRENYDREVTMSSFKESGAIEYSADVLIALSRPDQHKPHIMKGVYIKEKEEKQRYLRLKILKNRNGETNNSITYRYYPAFHLFEELGAFDDRAAYEAERSIEKYLGLQAKKNNTKIKRKEV